jgi:transposase
MITAAVERCAGIDVGKKQLSVCIMVGPLEGEAQVERQRFLTMRGDLERLRDWLKQQRITHVVMESTGSYWKPVFNVLEGSVQVYLANPQEVKNRRGHKTDDKDGWWLAHLLRHAMIHPSFIPPRPIRELRDLTRRRKRLLSAATSEKNRVQKVLEDANVKLGSVLSDVFGVSGQLMLEELLKGQAPPNEVAALAQKRAKKKIQIIAALEGHQMSAHHRRMIRYSLEHLRFLEEQLGELDADIAAHIEAAGLGKQWEDLRSIPGIQQTSAATILAETGADMKQFPSEKHFSSWAGVCPGNNQSGGKKNKGGPTTGGNPWLRSALTECAWAAASKKGCYLKDKFWRITTKHGGKKAPALVAVAHSLLLLIYETLRTGQLYQERNVPVISEGQRQRLIRHHIRRLGKLGIATRCGRARQPKGRRKQGSHQREVCAHSQPPLSSDSSPVCTKCQRWGIPCIHVRPRKPNLNQPGTASESTV